ncbi:MAG: acyl-CoA dehydrogenase family protein [Deltaproteobacteria bacterium]|nr:acyl-CoA dehydrogenase family protein [Deltaproteobacteria bacterium]MBW2445789.1 acyl-CoA dehydrogenase family protein [Deltaproteobacteria bacterium]
MSMILNDEQRMLQKTAREFVAEHAPVAHLRELRDEGDATGFSRGLWKQMAELGWAGIALPEVYGGSELGYAELGVVFEECGRTLAPTPLLSTVVLGAEVLLRAGSEPQQAELLPGVCSGDGILALAFQEAGRFAPYRVATKVTATADGHRLDGEKCFVVDGHVADRLIVVARSSGGEAERDGLSLFLVDPAAPGVEITRTIMADSRNAARVVFDGVTVGEEATLGRVGAAADTLDAVFDRATLALCAEMLGLASEAFERTVAYLKTREQFGAKIGSFQALKHRAATMFCDLELARSITLDGLRAIDEGREELPSLVSAAKARLADTAALVTCEAIQMHGGIGMTDEEEIGFFLKRARTAELFLGDATYHRDRFARLQGF